MIGRVLLAAILAGLVAGLLMGVIQHVRLTPLILQAEAFEHVAHGHSAEAHSHGEQLWSPNDGAERTFYTTATATLTAVGFALVLAGISFVSNIPITQSNGWIWGLCGFLAASLAPAVDLPPELPGVAATDLTTRQIWWVATVALTGLGLWLLAVAKDWWWTVAGLVNIVVPHIFAPGKPEQTGAPLPPSLVSEFVSNSLAANFMMWIAIGVALSYALKKFESVFKS
jgi:cobalt transporter subunit CbtA